MAFDVYTYFCPPFLTLLTNTRTMPVTFKLIQNQLDRSTMQTEALTTQLEK